MQQNKRERISLEVWKDRGTTQGHLLEYLDCDLEDGGSKVELAMEALAAYWLPLALKHKKVRGSTLKSAGRKAIAQLMQQIERIRVECDLQDNEMPFKERLCALSLGVSSPGVVVPTATAPPVPIATAPVPTVVEDTGDEDHGEEDDDDDGFWDSELDDPIALAEIEVDAGFRLS